MFRGKPMQRTEIGVAYDDEDLDAAGWFQYNSTTNRLDFNVRLRYAFAEGTDLWLAYNEGLATDRTPGDVGVIPRLSLSRALSLKYTHTFGF
jgi:hypothetical protein